MYVGLIEFDTHTDTIVAGKNTIVMSYTDKVILLSEAVARKHVDYVKTYKKLPK